jgi:hypothetical protein
VALALNPGIPLEPDPPAESPWDGAEPDDLAALAAAIRDGLAAGRVIGLQGFGEFVPVEILARRPSGTPIRVAVFSAYPQLKYALRP